MVLGKSIYLNSKRLTYSDVISVVTTTKPLKYNTALQIESPKKNKSNIEKYNFIKLKLIR